MEKEDIFFKSLDNVQHNWGEQSSKAQNPQERIEIHLRAIVAILGVFVEHELDKCECKKHK